ncbi:MAG: HlyD family efflux transporter periplasmic adaptor subunit [Verrucomicrobiota bacterium]|jgi:multidrug resistance efflux pump|nr:HlyD family efflux transporter periplasmic adaptor subunit [Verrucomicrobiota bacterium]
MERAEKIAAAAVVAALALLAGCSGQRRALADGGADRFYTVKRGTFNVAFRLEGQLDAISNQQLRFDGKRGHGQLKLVELVPDRTSVASNDVIFKLSDEWFVEQDKELTRKLQLAEEDYKLALQDMEMIRADNLTELKTSADALRTAQEQFDKYKDEDAPRKKKDMVQVAQDKSSAYDTAKSALDDAKKTLTDAISQEAETIVAAEKKVAEAEKGLVAAEQAMDKAFYELRIYKRYEYPQKLSSLQETVMKSRLAVQRTIINNNAKISKKRIEIANRETLITDYRNDLKGVRTDMDKLVIRAQADGMLIHGENRRNRWDTPKEIKVGADVSIGEPIGVIPDVSKFKVQVNIPEEYRSRIKIGLPVVIRAKAVPDLTLTGEIVRISGASTPIIPWDQSSPKVYASDISTNEADERLAPGMTVQVEIVVEKVDNALYVPVEGVYNRGGKSYCKVRTGDDQIEREVKTGRFSTDFVEVAEGLSEDAQVLLDLNGQH